jgi:thiaminase|nr:MAG TPA_asm: hypothetical protein [Caudoviricetes sp.]
MKKENLIEVSYKELGTYIQDKCSSEFERFYSDNVDDYESTEVNTWCNKEDEELIEYQVEVVEKGKAPLIITYYVNYVFNADDEIIEQRFYL